MKKIPHGATHACTMLIALSALASPACAEPLLSSVFSDHMVVQRDAPIAVWGDADPGSRVTVKFGKRSKAVDANAEGDWRAEFPAMKAGGPYVLSATAGGASETGGDVMIGDVYLCAGQSNMEFPVSRALNPQRELAAAANDRIRLLKIDHASAAAPERNFQSPVEWEVASAESVEDFSALCFFFAKDIIADANAPIGLVDSSWGGSRIEAWMSDEALGAFPEFEERLKLLTDYRNNPQQAREDYARLWIDWWENSKNAPPLPLKGDAKSGSWKTAPAEKTSWKTWGDPDLASHDGMVWHRKQFTLTEAQAAQDATLSLGGIDEIDMTWINGNFVNGSFGWGSPRRYDVAASALQPGENELLVNVYSSWDAAGMYGPDEEMALTFPDGSSVSLSGGWRYRKAPAEMGAPPQAPWQSINGLSGLHNAMIAPLGETKLAGAMWYQGESNTGDADAYEGLLGAMTADWRRQFGDGLPVMIVQLPVFGALPAAPAHSGWARLRDAQRRVAEADDKTGLIVALDAGIPNELHPPDKQLVAKRAAALARTLVYGESAAAAPSPARAYKNGDGVIVDFANLSDMKTIGAPQPIAFELCEAGGGCRYVPAEVESGGVRLSAPAGFEPAHVRYCWGDAPICNWYDASGTPVTPFEIAIE